MTEPDKDAARTRRLLPPLPRIPRIAWADLAEAVGPVLLLTVAAILLALHFVRPAPPGTITLSSGPDGSNFRTVAERYAKILARKGVTLKILPSEGSQQNLDRLADAGSGVDVALVQGGVTTTADTVDLVSLGSVFYQPMMVFYAGRPIARLSELRGRRIAIGPPGSGTRALALALLKGNGIEDGGATTLLDLEGEAARKALLRHEADAIFVSGDSAAVSVIGELLHADGLRLFDFQQGDAYARRYRFLNKLSIPPGAFDLGENLPAQAVTLVAPTVELLAHGGLHPALSDLLIEAAREVHSHGGLLQSPNEFPAPLPHDWPISDDATRYYTSGKSIAYRLLPFWLASLVNRAVAVLVPVLIVLIPGLRVVPTIYDWRINRRIYARYGELMALERAALLPLSPEQRGALLERLAEVEKSVIALKMPGGYAEQLYILRQHIRFVAGQLSGSDSGKAAACKA